MRKLNEFKKGVVAVATTTGATVIVERRHGSARDPVVEQRAFAPVVEQLHHHGADCYRHADRTFTATIVRIETVSGKELQIPLC